jgi:filamentous hemagglutinin
LNTYYAATGPTITTAGVTSFTTTGVVANAAFTSVVAQASLSLINNQGNLGAVLKDLGSSQALVSLAIAMVTAGVLHGIGGTEFIQGLKTPVTDPSLLTLAQKAQNALVDSLARSAVSTATDVIISGHAAKIRNKNKVCGSVT